MSDDNNKTSKTPAEELGDRIRAKARSGRKKVNVSPDINVSGVIIEEPGSDISAPAPTFKYMDHTPQTPNSEHTRRIRLENGIKPGESGYDELGEEMKRQEPPSRTR